MVIFDAHCDTLQKITDIDGSLFENPFHTDIKRLNENREGRVQFFAAYINKKEDSLPPFQRCNQMVNVFLSEMKIHNSYAQHCLCVNDIRKSLAEGKVASILSIEGGEALEGSIENLCHFYKKGVRCMTITWNYANEICDGISEKGGKGLSEFGKAAVAEMNRLGMIIDVSHISEKGFWDVAEYSKAPFIASHSNAYKLCPHPRNLKDSQIEAIIKKGGCIGINLYPPFLSQNKACIDDIIRHIEYILSLGGENNIGLGCDFDGIDCLPEGICDVRDLYKLFDRMSMIGYTDLQIKKLASENFLNFTEKILV